MLILNQNTSHPLPNLKRKLKKSFLISTFVAASIMSVNPSLAAPQAKDTSYWWPEQLDLKPMRQNAIESNPMGADFNYAQAFNKLDLQAVKKDLAVLMKTSQDWWPADWGHYGPLFIRMAWHSAGVYRIFDGRGGASGAQQRFEALNSWPDNVSLDKARRLLWPIKQKYGEQISWGDLMVLAGNVALEDMGFETFGFAGGRIDDFESEIVNWGPEQKMLSDQRHGKDGELDRPLAATEMGLIYVNPEGPHGKPDPLASAKQIRDAFARMAMNDEETVALIAGGHTFGKAHGAHKPNDCLSEAPAIAAIEEQGLGWKNRCGKGHSEDTITSGLEGAWTFNPTQWTSQYLDNLMNIEWVVTKSPAGGVQWTPKDAEKFKGVPDAHIPGKKNAPMMFTTDIALKEDPAYRKIVERFQKDPKEYQRAFAKAWFKLTHRDAGPASRYLGSEVPKEVLIWQDPIPALDHPVIEQAEIIKLKAKIQKSGLSDSELVRTAWASAATYRGSDMRGGANGGRINLLPQRNWEVNSPKELSKVLAKLEKIQTEFNQELSKNTATKGKKVSLADLIVLAGSVGVENSAKKAGYKIDVPFTPGRMDARQDQTDVESFAVLKPTADAFRNFFSDESPYSPTEMLIEKSTLLTLTIPEMTVLLGGMRSMNANTNASKHGVLTDKPGTLTNDFFVNLLDMSVKWSKSEKTGIYEGHDRKTGKLKWTATPVDLILGSNSELRAVAEVYAYQNSEEKFINDFVRAWTKVMNLDRFDLALK
jgi:catalase-peroxidase